MEPRNDRLVLDIGNSRTKVALFSDGRMVMQGVLANGDGAGVRAFLEGGQVARVVVGSVAREDRHLMEELEQLGTVQVITGATPSCIRNIYTRPEDLGADRWANATGASLLFPSRAVLAIALGTCVTYDLVDANGAYLGGMISPGFRMRARALGEFTARLPIVEPPSDPVRLGRSTEECLSAGVHHGLRAELLATIKEIRQQHPEAAVVLTGGDGLRFAQGLENGIFAHPFLTLYGLHALSIFDRPADGAPSPR